MSKVKFLGIALAISIMAACSLSAGATVTEEQSTIPFGTPAEEGGEVKYGPHIVDALIEKGVNVTAIFSPEHGFRGSADAGENVASSTLAMVKARLTSLESICSRKLNASPVRAIIAGIESSSVTAFPSAAVWAYLFSLEKQTISRIL